MTDQTTGTPPATEPAAQPAAASPEVPTTPARPEWLPSKFKTPEDLAKSYAELERKLGAPPAPEAPAAPSGPLDLSEFTKAFAETGQASEEQIQAIAGKLNVSDAFVRQYIEGAKALEVQRTNDLLRAAGGKETYEAAVAWATSRLSPSEIAAFNTALEGSQASAELAVSGLVSRYRTSTGTPARQVEAGPSGSVGASEAPFGSSQELVLAIRDPRYKIDPAYRQKVAERVARSPTL